MAENDSKPAVGEERQNNITEYLQTPRRKRKNYVILAMAEGFSHDLLVAISGHVRKSFPHLALSNPKSGKEFSRQFGRNISLVVIHDDFEPGEETFELVAALKKKRKSELIPILFLTKEPADLVKKYHKHLLAYQETDEYLEYTTASRQKLFARIQDGIEHQNKRRSRRYRIDQPVTFFHLNRGDTLDAKFVDLSIHGAQIVSKDDCLFREGDQLKVNIPTYPHLPRDNGDFLKISAKVRRVFIGGNHASISFEYLSEFQIGQLTTLLTSIVTQNMENTALPTPAPEPPS